MVQHSYDWRLTQYSHRAHCYEQLEFFRRGLKDCDAALALRPDLADAYYYKGRLLSLYCI